MFKKLAISCLNLFSLLVCIAFPYIRLRVSQYVSTTYDANKLLIPFRRVCFPRGRRRSRPAVCTKVFACSKGGRLPADFQSRFDRLCDRVYGRDLQDKSRRNEIFVPGDRPVSGGKSADRLLAVPIQSRSFRAERLPRKRRINRLAPQKKTPLGSFLSYSSYIDQIYSPSVSVVKAIVVVSTQNASARAFPRHLA